jgi:hypothetical protein
MNDKEFMARVEWAYQIGERNKRNAKPCARCGTDQVQITDLIASKWRCRVCRYEFTLEVPPCEACTVEGHFVVDGVPGVLAHIYPERQFVPEWVNRCDTCAQYPDDDAAVKALLDAGFVSRRPA